ncbi:MAG: hypothetical protein HY909_12255 [Deltaproteobacteria bacterium]|nr:hypothetical protein [Deltaproteobacteria bacterium]
MVGLLLARFARLRRPRFEPTATFAAGALTVGVVRVGEKTLGWAVNCGGREVVSRLGSGAPEARLEGSWLRVGDRDFTALVDPGTCRVWPGAPAEGGAGHHPTP